MLDKFVTSLTSPTVGFLLKVFAGLTTAAFGVLGVGAKTREDDGRLNRKGWIALIGILFGGVLAVGTSVYDFASGQEKEQADLRRSERLMLSVQSGVYPMRHMTVSFEMSLANDFEGAVAYRQSLRDQISKDPECKTAKSRFECIGIDEHGDTYEYRIYCSSPLLPRNRSPVHDVLDSLYICVALFKQVRPVDVKQNGGKKIKFLGRFLVDWRQGLPKDVWLAYDYERDSLSFGADKYTLKDDSVVDAGVYSLVDFFPGIIGASPNVSNIGHCGRNVLSQGACLKRTEAVYKGLALRELTLAFPYPKHIRLTDSQARVCTSEGRQFLLLDLPADIEAIDSMGNIENFKPDPSPRQVCEDLEADSRG
jgi:hypothetical protein